MEPVPFLLVDDLEENLLSLEALLRRDDLRLLKARSGDEALELLLQHDVALALVDVQIFVIDVAGGDKVPRKGGPGIETSDLLVINKSDLAPHVGADLEVMAADAAAKRGPLPFVITSLRDQPDAAAVAAFIRSCLRSWPADAHEHEHDDHDHRDHDGAGSLAR